MQHVVRVQQRVNRKARFLTQTLQSTIGSFHGPEFRCEPTGGATGCRTPTTVLKHHIIDRTERSARVSTLAGCRVKVHKSIALISITEKVILPPVVELDHLAPWEKWECGDTVTPQPPCQKHIQHYFSNNINY